MASTQAPETHRPRAKRLRFAPRPPRRRSNTGDGASGRDGVALFMVLAAVSMLAILVTEFTYTAQVNQKIAYDGLDQLKAHYLAKTGLKLSLLRLKAYQNVKNAVAGASGGGAVPGLNRQLVEKIWSFPFFYPIPTNLPGMTLTERDLITKFQNSSGLDGKFSALIESESSKHNLNSIVPRVQAWAAASPSPSPSARSTAASSGSGGAGAPNPNPNPSPSIDPEEARKSLSEYLYQLVAQKAEGDTEFAAEYRDFKPDELIDALAGWSDVTYERRNQASRDAVPLKRAPFYSLSELHMISGMDDTLYDLFAPNLTVSMTGGVNVNTVKKEALHALVPQMNADELAEFFKFRDNEEQDNTFKDADAFFKYLTKVSSFRGSEAEVQKFRESLDKRGIRIITDESQFKITVQASVNQSTRTIEAWVTLSTPKKSGPTPPVGGGAGSPAGGLPSATGTSSMTSPSRPDTGLRITYMRIL